MIVPSKGPASPPESEAGYTDRTLFGQLRWVIGLRWIAGSAVLLVSLLDWFVLGWYERSAAMAGVGGAILLYNVAARWLTRRRRARRRLLVNAGVQILLDLAALSLLTAWTGGAQSPVLGFFVFHMVFASLLLSRLMAYAAAATASVLLAISLEVFGVWPAGYRERLTVIGWIITLLLTVYLANRIVQRLRHHRARLAERNRRIRLMSRELRRQQQALVQHEKMAAMGQMAAGVAHEIANPLANMDSILQLVQRNPDRMSERNAQRLREQVQRVQQIVQHLTEFAHPTETRWQTVRLDELVEKALAMTRFDRRHKKIEIQRDLAPGGCRVRVQPHAVQQVLVNILINAFDAVEQRESPQVRVRTDCSASMCRVEIIDNGPGISPMHVDRVFEPFFTTKPVGRGTGLGLAISFKLIEAQHGRIRIDSEVDGGTRVTVEILRADRCADRAAGPSAGEPGPCCGQAEAEASVDEVGTG